MTAEIDCAIMAFANSSLFVPSPGEEYKPFMSIAGLRKFVPKAKLLVAIGGWGDTAGFSAGAKDRASQQLYAENVAKMVETHSFDGVGM
jgi:chitinase